METDVFHPKWLSIEQGELRVILEEIIGGPGQTDILHHGRRKFFLPLAGSDARIVIEIREKAIVALHPGPAFDAPQWRRAATELDDAANPVATGVARGVAFSTRRVHGSWRGPESGVQISPPPAAAPDAIYEIADHPFVLEVPVALSTYGRVEAHRRAREIRRTTLLLNVLLAGRISSPLLRSRHLWAAIEREGAAFDIAWVQEFYAAPLTDGADYLAPSGDRIAEVPLDEYYGIRGNDGTGLKVPDDLDAAIMRYRRLPSTLRAKFDRAMFWLDQASRVWDISMSASFAALVSAIEALTPRGNTHKYGCPVCKKDTQHEVPGTTRRFMNLVEEYAGGESAASERGAIYQLRSDILHGSDLIQLDDSFAFHWDPVFHTESELHRILWNLAGRTLRGWLAKPPKEPDGDETDPEDPLF